MRVLESHLSCWIIWTFLAKEVTSSCDVVKSAIGDLKVIKENPRDSRCLESTILQKSENERYCIAKEPDPNKKQTLECKGAYLYLFKIVF